MVNETFFMPFSFQKIFCFHIGVLGNRLGICKLEAGHEGLHQYNFGKEEIIEMADNVNHPPHYKAHPSGVECIEITEHMNFCLGNAMKYIWRADHKADAIEDLEKAKWYLEREIALRKKQNAVVWSGKA